MDKKLKKIFSKIIGIKESSIKPSTSPKNTKNGIFSTYESYYGFRK